MASLHVKEIAINEFLANWQTGKLANLIMLPKLISALIEKKILDEKLLEQYIQDAKKASIDTEEFLLKKGIVSDIQLATIKGEIFDIPFVNLEDLEVTHEIVTLIPQSVAENYELVLFELTGKNAKIALVNPNDYRGIEAIDFWAKKEGYTLQFFIATRNGYRSVMKSYTPFKKEVSAALDTLEETQNKERSEKREKKKIIEIIRKAPVASIVDLLIQEAVDERASDIHIDPGKLETLVRFRIDGILHHYLSLPIHLHNSIVARIKVLSQLKIDETRVPQDGRIRQNIYGQEINLRVSTLPMFLGEEKIVMRILPATTKTLTLEELGFWHQTLDDLKRIIARPTGVMLVSGPTGSGKSTTLFSILSALNKESVNIATLEDPVEYSVPGANQVQINADVGLTFSGGLRALLRQDPNIIMVGEIRDIETAELAIHAALTGQFLLSTIHAKDVLGVIPRLIDMHVEPFLVAAALNMILAQRLVRKICPACKIQTSIPEILEKEIHTELELLPDKEVLDTLESKSKLVFYKGKGCDECSQSGYKGRSVVAESFIMTEEAQEIIGSKKFSSDDLLAEMKRQKRRTFKQDAILKIVFGHTTVEEMLRVTRE